MLEWEYQARFFCACADNLEGFSQGYWNVDRCGATHHGASAFDDESLLKRATELNRVFFSQDRDLLTIAH
jgi:hypothetical protein